MRLIKLIKNNKQIFLIITLLIVFVVLLFLEISSIFLSNEEHELTNEKSKPDEIIKILETKDLNKQVQKYKELIERKGAVDAQEYLHKSGLPFNGQSHLLNHTAGDWLYGEHGASGLVYCKDYFLQSCYHGFIIRLIGESGLSAVSDAMGECKKQGGHVYAQCSHAIGHGFLAWVGYAELTQALDLCDRISAEINNFPVFNCYDGVFMENVWAAHEGGKTSSDRWVDVNDPQYPCNDTRIKEKYLQGCWSNQPSIMHEIFKGDLRRIGEECVKLTSDDFKTTCFNALSRQIHPFTDGSADKTFVLCSNMPSKEWEHYCVKVIASADFSVGGRDVGFDICDKIYQQVHREECYGNLIGQIKAFAKNSEEKNLWCNKIKEESLREECLNSELYN